MVYVTVPRVEKGWHFGRKFSQVIALIFFSGWVVWPIQVMSSDFDTPDSEFSTTLLTELWAELYTSILLSSSASGRQRKIMENKARQNCIQMQPPPLCSWVSCTSLNLFFFFLLKDSDSRT